MLSDGWNKNVRVAMPAGVGGVAVVVRPRLADEMAAVAEESLRALRTNAAHLEELAGQAEGLEARVDALIRREWDLVGARSELDEAVAENAVTAADLARRETDLQLDRQQMQTWANRLSREQEMVEGARVQLEEKADELARREARFASRWRWLLRAWRWRPPLPGGKARLCELLFVPSSDGYKLLEQEGVALRPGSTMTGLLAEERTFVVGKIAQWSYDGRWCAYLQQEQPKQARKGVA